MPTYSIAIAAMLAWAAMMLPARAYACTCSTEPLYHTQPADGSENVPRDIAPVLEGPFDPATVTLQDEHGASLTFTLNVGPRLGCVGGWGELLPEQPLAANTRYTIRAGALYSGALAPDELVASVSFTTGNDELADQPLVPPELTAASVLRGAPDCGGLPTTLACIGGLEEQAPIDLELIARRGDKVLLRITSLVQDDGGYGLEEQPDCIELRRRAADGRRSAPTKICGDALLTRDYRDSDAKQNGWVECKDGIVGDRDAYDESTGRDSSTPAASPPRKSEATPTDSGCSVAAGASSDLSRALPFAIGCALLLGACRRRKR